MSDELPFRVMPRVDDENEFFWTSGRDGVLRFLRCQACATFVHPPSPVCPACLGRQLAPEAVSGKATLLTYTINHQAWAPGPLPYVIAIVGIDEQPDVRLTTNLVGVDPEVPDAFPIGMPVEVVFEDRDPIYIPLFKPAAS